MALSTFPCTNLNTSVPISNLGYSQDSINGRFQDGRSLFELFRQILMDPEYIQKVDPIPVILKDGRYYAMDGNRRLFVYKQLAKFGHIKEVNVKNGFENWGKFTTRDDGHSIEIRNLFDQRSLYREFEDLWETHVKQEAERPHDIMVQSKTVPYFSSKKVDSLDAMSDVFDRIRDSLEELKDLLTNYLSISRTLQCREQTAEEQKDDDTSEEEEGEEEEEEGKEEVEEEDLGKEACMKDENSEYVHQEERVNKYNKREETLNGKLKEENKENEILPRKVRAPCLEMHNLEKKTLEDVKGEDTGDNFCGDGNCKNAGVGLDCFTEKNLAQTILEDEKLTEFHMDKESDGKRSCRCEVSENGKLDEIKKNADEKNWKDQDLEDFTFGHIKRLKDERRWKEVTGRPDDIDKFPLLSLTSRDLLLEKGTRARRDVLGKDKMQGKSMLSGMGMDT